MTMNAALKHRIVRPFQNKVVNPLAKWAIEKGYAPAGYALLETTGRKSGVARQTPVGNGLVGEQFWIVAEHGRRAAYVRNIEADPRVRVRIRDGRRQVWRSGTATALPDDDPRERQRWLGETGPGRASNARAVRMFGSDLMTVRIDLDPL
jgi:deazaflavin-dependent oxidoreductase (nitroreductase family)